MKFNKLFEPTRIGKVQIKNRIAMAPMGILGMLNQDGTIAQRGIDYYTERARGGVGLIIAGLFKVENEVERMHAVTVYEPMIIPEAKTPFGELAESVHYFGTKIFTQLTAGFGRVIGGRFIEAGVSPVGASAIQAYWRPQVTMRALTTLEVEKIVRAFGIAAEIVATADIDGIELHGHEGYLFDQFTTTIWNKRTDKYGGNLEDRLRFPIEALNTIKDRLGKSFPVIYRFGLKHFMRGPWSGALTKEGYAEAGRDIAEGLEMAGLLEKAGFDALHVDAGCYDSYYWAHPPTYQPHGCMVDMAAEAKKVVNIPIIAVGKLGIPELVEKVLEEGKADMVAMGRALLSDPYWPKKAQEGRVEDIRPCIGCHDGCLGRMTEMGGQRPQSCTVNPSSGRERLYELRPAEKLKKILIAGGGVSGMEVARVATLRGHEVTLYEKSEKLGGHLIEASVPNFKDDIGRLLNWYNVQLKKLNVKTRLKTEVRPELLRKEKPDVVVVATGSKPIIPKIPGIEKHLVATCIDLLLNKKKVGDAVVVMGGGLVGCETALWLAKQNKKVTIVEMLPEVATGVFHANRVMLLDMLAQNNVDIITGASIQEVNDDGVIVIDNHFKSSVIKCDTVALALGLKSDKGLYESLRGEVTDIYEIGDCKEPGKIMQAIWDGYNVGRVV